MSYGSRLPTTTRTWSRSTRSAVASVTWKTRVVQRSRSGYRRRPPAIHPAASHRRPLQLVDTFTRQAGRHQLKAGFDFSYIDQRLQKLPLHFGGRYVFQALTASQAASVGLPGPVDDALQALALGVPNSYLQGYGNSAVSGPYSDISLFAEDEWRVANRVTLKLGVRYQNQFWPQMTENVPGLPPYGWPSDNNNVAPRVGVSWEPLGDRKTLVRGTYGVFYNNLITSLWGLAAGISGTPDHVETLSLRRTDAYKAWRTADRKWPEPAGAFSSFAYSIQPGLNRRMPTKRRWGWTASSRAT